MKVICKQCACIIDEEDAIKLSFADYKEMRQILEKTLFITLTSIDYSRYTQICAVCYDIYLFRNNEVQGENSQ